MDANPLILERSDVEIPYYTWRVERPRAVLVFLHGLKSHAGWFLETGKVFAEQGIKVYAFDRRGSGRSKEKRGHIEDYHLWLDDIDSILELAGQENPDHTPHLLGHCFGAKQALAYVINDPLGVKSLTLIAPPQLSLKADITFPEKCKVFVTIASGRKLTVNVPVRDDMYTRDAEKNRFIREDKLRLKQMTTHFCREIFKMDRLVNKNLERVSVPTLILLASEDDVVDNVKIKRKLFMRLGCHKKDLEIFDCYHHLFFEPFREKVVNRIVEWISTELR